MIESVQPVLMSRDIVRSIRFYEALGFRETFVDDADTPRYAAVERDGVELHLQWHDAEEWTHPVDRPTYRFLVRDPDAFHAELEGSGALDGEGASGGPWARPADTPWGTREFHVRDPDGNGLQFYRAIDRS